MTEKTNPIPVNGLLTTTPNTDWNDYNLHTHNVFVNGEGTNVQAIVYNDRFVNFMSKYYKVLPNEDVVKTADLVAEQLNCKQFQPTDYSDRSWFKGDGSHVISNPEKTQISATYLFDETDITGRGDNVQYGFTVRNSIDGKGGSFSISPFTHRQACDNIAFHLAYDKQLHGETDDIKIGSGIYDKLVKLDETEVLKTQLKEIQLARVDFKAQKFKKRHTTGLDLGYVTTSILEVKNVADTIIRKYKQMVDLKLLQSEADKLVRDMPVAITKCASDLKDSVISYDAKKKEVTIGNGATKWEVFNNYTEALSYATNKKYNKTLDAYKQLDRILVQPIEVVA